MRPVLLRARRSHGHAVRRERHPRKPAVAGDHLGSSYDAAVERAREAGGPMDEASYTCACGYLFSAPVSTSVSCPHCGAGQAW
jgi:hypothetical protein